MKILPAIILLGGLTLVLGFLTVKNSSRIATEEPERLLTSVLSTQNTAEGLKIKFEQSKITGKKIKILIVPGHEPDYGGAQYKDLLERDMAVDLAMELALYLKTTNQYDVIVARGKDAWNPILQNYFDENWDAIEAFKDSTRKHMAALIDEGTLLAVDGAIHNAATPEAAVHLFGIIDWANKNGVDSTIHIHFNDNTRKVSSQPGKYNGFAIYVPEKQYSNAKVTQALSKNIYARLSRIFPTSNLIKEDQGIVEDQDLIAIGQGNSAKGASMLIEYGYIYEPQFSDAEIQKTILKEMAYQTYRGVEDFFIPPLAEVPFFETTLLPHTWQSPLLNNVQSGDAIALQAALTLLDLYPPKGEIRNDCPLNGFFGPCTKQALTAFQEKFGITGEKNTLGIKTREKLNALYGSVTP